MLHAALDDSVKPSSTIRCRRSICHHTDGSNMDDSSAGSGIEKKSSLLIDDTYEFSYASSGLSAVDAELDASEVFEYLL